MCTRRIIFEFTPLILSPGRGDLHNTTTYRVRVPRVNVECRRNAILRSVPTARRDILQYTTICYLHYVTSTSNLYAAIIMTIEFMI